MFKISIHQLQHRRHESRKKNNGQMGGEKSKCMFTRSKLYVHLFISEQPKYVHGNSYHIRKINKHSSLDTRKASSWPFRIHIISKIIRTYAKATKHYSKIKSLRCYCACTHLKQHVAWNHPPAHSIDNEVEEDYLPPLHTQMPPSVFLTTQGMAAIYEMEGYCHPIS